MEKFFMLMINKIRKKLDKYLSPHSLEILNDSHKHKGHAMSPNNGQSHFTIFISSDEFYNKSMIECHKLIYQALAEEMTQGIHALSIRLI